MRKKKIIKTLKNKFIQIFLEMYSLFHINWCRLCIRVSAKKVEVKI